jgi:hypothetical protein
MPWLGEACPLIHTGEGDGYLRTPERGRDRWFNVQDFPSGGLLRPSVGWSAKEDVHRLVGFLEVIVAPVGFLLALIVVRRPWVWSILECSPELIALLGGVIALQMPRALLFQQVF